MDYRKIDELEKIDTHIRKSLDYLVRAAIEIEVLNKIEKKEMELYSKIIHDIDIPRGIYISPEEISGFYIPKFTFFCGGIGRYDVFTRDDINLIMGASALGELDEEIIKASSLVYGGKVEKDKVNEIINSFKAAVRDRPEFNLDQEELFCLAHNNWKIVGLMHDQQYREAWRNWSTKKIGFIPKALSLYERILKLSNSAMGKPELLSLVEYYTKEYCQ